MSCTMDTHIHTKCREKSKDPPRDWFAVLPWRRELYSLRQELGPFHQTMEGDYPHTHTYTHMPYTENMCVCECERSLKIMSSTCWDKTELTPSIVKFFLQIFKSEIVFIIYSCANKKINFRNIYILRRIKSKFNIKDFNWI